MPTLQLKINNKYFTLSCDEGQEEDLKNAAASLNIRLNKVHTIIPNATPDLALVVTALMMQDELFSYENNSNHDKQIITSADSESVIVSTLDSISACIEELALKIEKC